MPSFLWNLGRKSKRWTLTKDLKVPWAQSCTMRSLIATAVQSMIKCIWYSSSIPLERNLCHHIRKLERDCYDKNASGGRPKGGGEINELQM